MQGWEDYEADYFGGYPEEGMRWGTGRDERLCPVDRQGRSMCADMPWREEMRPGGPMQPGMREMRPNGPVQPGMRDMGPGRRIQPGRGDVGPERWMGREMPYNRNVEAAPGMQGAMEMNSGAEMIRDLDEFEALMGSVGKELLQVIRRMCDSMDGDGCIAMDGELTRELMDMLVDRVMEETEETRRTEREPMMEREETRRAEREPVMEMAVETAAGTGAQRGFRQIGDARRNDDTLRELISQLLFQELLRRRHRRRYRYGRPGMGNNRKR